MKLISFLSIIPLSMGVFYLPGVPPKTYQKGQRVALNVNKLTSTQTQIPYEYYSLPYCRPKIHVKSENLGERMAGDLIENSLYKLEMKIPKGCAIICRKELNSEEARAFRTAIDEDYRVHMILDNLPAATVIPNEADPSEPYYIRGFPVGFRAVPYEGAPNINHYIFNHLRIVVSYNQDPPPSSLTSGNTAAALQQGRGRERGRNLQQFNGGGAFADDDDDAEPANGPSGGGGRYQPQSSPYAQQQQQQQQQQSQLARPQFTGARIVGFRIEPYSVRHGWDTWEEFDAETTILNTCNAVTQVVDDPSNYQDVDAPQDIIFTYDVMWELSEVKWSNRWDVYLRGHPDDKIHWFSITNSTMIVLFLAVMVAMIMYRALNRDIVRYNEMSREESQSQSKEESGWKLVHGDVFRPPKAMPMLLSVLYGTGVQLCLMSLFTLTFALLGLLSPANRGSLVTAFILLFTLMGAFAGYYSSRLYKQFRGTDWKRNTMLTALLYPGLAFGTFFILDLVLWWEGSSGAVPFGTFFLLLVLWFGVSVPLVFVGSYLGYRKEAVEAPVRTNQIPRMVPPQPWYMRAPLVIFLGGILPFGAVSVELFFVMSALWLHQVYYIFGFLFVVGIILFATCAEITIVLCYFQLCNEDYRWWWKSFLSAGSCSVYIMLYAVWYFQQQLEISGAVPTLLYFGYMFLISATAFLVTGTVGFAACHWFVHKIYASIKVD